MIDKDSQLLYALSFINLDKIVTAFVTKTTKARFAYAIKECQRNMGAAKMNIGRTIFNLCENRVSIISS